MILNVCLFVDFEHDLVLDQKSMSFKSICQVLGNEVPDRGNPIFSESQVELSNNTENHGI